MHLVGFIIRNEVTVFPELYGPFTSNASFLILINEINPKRSTVKRDAEYFV